MVPLLDSIIIYPVDSIIHLLKNWSQISKLKETKVERNP